MAIPVFWLGIMMSRFFGVSLGWFPVSGYGKNFVGHLHHLFLPAQTPHTVLQVSDGALWLAIHLHPTP